ncbi:hypothetical protein FRB94_010978 [Tulasnella sp. JGI-2019a]|nr:hypothetical protein FRB93_010624 [Tulasnella sp. JGI-2019a]KAG8993158.1 hypothetical protein FRB94_010978 [Tulasnella sp. JGI-2019a]
MLISLRRLSQLLYPREMYIRPKIPNELWLQIINNIGQPVHASAYRLDPGCADALTQLCLVSRTLNALTVPVLYSRVYVTPTNLESFSNTIGAKRDRIGNSNRNVAPSATATLVKSLALAGFGEGEDHPSMDTYWHRISCVLVALKPFLVRLFFDVYSPGKPDNPHTTQLSSAILDNTYQRAMYNAIRALSVIEEFCCTDTSLGPDTVPAWRTVRRMAMAGRWLNGRLLDNLSKLEALKKCILAWPNGLQADEEFLLSVVQGNWTTTQATELVMVTSHPSHWIVRRLKGAWITKRDLGGPKSGGEATLAVIEMSRANRNIQFSKMVLDGSIWDLYTEPWDIYCMGVDPMT